MLRELEALHEDGKRLLDDGVESTDNAFVPTPTDIGRARTPPHRRLVRIGKKTWAL